MNYKDQLYINLYVQRRRLMTLDARKNKEEVNVLTAKIKVLRDGEGVSDEVMKMAPYVPWR